MHSQRDRDGMLLVLPVPLRVEEDNIWFEAQACNGLERWADNFGKVLIAAPVLPSDLLAKDNMTIWRGITTLAKPERFEFIPLPWAYSMREFLTHYRETRSLLATLIARCQYLQFAIGSLWGDWAAIAALEARKQQRAYAIHTDRVDYEVILQTSKHEALPQRLKARANSFLIQQYHQWIIKHCHLGLWHGQDCYRAYSAFCRNNYLIHDIHTKPNDAISAVELAEKLERALTDRPLRVCYAGRMDPMKAPLEWVRAIAKARELGANLEAVWLGEGSLRNEMEQLIRELGLTDCIRLAGFERDRSKLLQQIRDAHLMVFTHITPESPRCLIESLICGTPIVGYSSHYAEDLVKGSGGGQFVPIHNWQQLGEQLKTLADDRRRLAQLIQQAAASGTHFNDEVVFRERSQLIKSQLLSPHVPYIGKFAKA